MQKITTFLTYDNQAEEAAKFYTSIFKNSKIKQITHYGDTGPMPKGTVMTVQFEINGQDFIGLNGGPHFKFTEGISLLINCADQKEIDYYWEKLSADGGKEIACGWVKDKFGLFWQVAPGQLHEWLDGSTEKSDRVMKEVVKMTKLDYAKMKAAAGQ